MFIGVYESDGIGELAPLGQSFCVEHDLLLNSDYSFDSNAMHQDWLREDIQMGRRLYHICLFIRLFYNNDMLLLRN